MKLPFFISIPHSGEKIPDETPWLQHLPEPIQMCDVDRFVDQVYRPAIEAYQLPAVIAEWHRYVVDLNRLPDDVDADSVEGSGHPSGKFPIGLHWSVTTQGDRLMSQPMSMGLHELLLQKYWQPFHNAIQATYKEMKSEGHTQVFQLDAHSMPSIGTEKHRDPGQQRAEIVVSDFEGKSCSAAYRDLVVQSYKDAGFEVKVNWPYIGGRVTQTYGWPDKGQHCIQVEMNRAIYMDEASKKLIGEKAEVVKDKVKKAVDQICRELPKIL